MRHSVRKIFIASTTLAFSVHSFANYDLSFVKDLRGAEVFLSGKIPAGNYLVDVNFNNNNYPKYKLDIEKATSKDSICIPKNLFYKLGLPVSLKKVAHVYDDERDCYEVHKIKFANVNLNLQSLILSIKIPQIYLENKVSDYEWDYGTTGGVLNYYLRGSKSWGKGKGIDSQSAFGNFDAHINYDRWVLSSNFNIDSQKGLDSSDLRLSTAVKELKGDLSLGWTSTRSLYTPDFYYKGLSLTSNQAMKDNHYHIYAPTISGTLASTSTITIKQDNRTLYSKVVPSGEYIINDYTPINNGDIEVIIEGEDGTIKKEKLNVSIIPGLLKSGDYKYNFSIGERDKGLRGLFGFGEIAYGFENGTLSINGLAHSNYSNMGLGIALPLSWAGALSTNINLSHATYESRAFQPQNSETQRGMSFGLNYAKDIDASTNLQLLTYQYQNEGYVDFSEFTPENIHQNNKRRSRYEASLRHKIGDSYLTSTLWLQDYRGDINSESGFSILLSKTFKNNISVNIQGYHQDNGISEAFGTSASINIPFDLWDKKQFSTTTLSYDSNNGSSLSNALSVKEDDDISYNLNTSVGEKGNYSISASTSVKKPSNQFNFGTSNSNYSNSIYGNISGSIAGAKGAGIAWSPNRSNTIAIANTKGLDGIKFRRSVSPTNKYGNTIIPLSDYRENSVSIDANGIPMHTEFLKTSDKVIPTSSAIIVKEFDYLNVHRYILQILDERGKPLKSGIQVKDDSGAFVGTISSDGVLIATVLGNSNQLKTDNGCTISLTGLKKNESTINETICSQ